MKNMKIKMKKRREQRRKEKFDQKNRGNKTQINLMIHFLMYKVI